MLHSLIPPREPQGQEPVHPPLTGYYFKRQNEKQGATL